MKHLILLSAILITLVTASYAQKHVEKTLHKKTATGKMYIPVDLDDCMQQLDKIFDDSNKTQIKAMTETQFSREMHHSFGMWIRNNWGLWKGSRLSKYFKSKGIYHPDDMSGIILNSYYRYLTGQEIKLDEQIQYYQDYWKKAKAKELE